MRRLTGAKDFAVVSFDTEGGLFQATGFSTVVFGPGSIDQAHQPNEFIALEQVAACEAFMKRCNACQRVAHGRSVSCGATGSGRTF